MAELGGDELTAAEKAELRAAREKRIKAERAKLVRLLKPVDPERKRGVASLIASAAFMAVTLADLEDDINENGCTSTYQNGEHQWGTKKSPAVEAYNSLMQRYLSAMKQLLDLLPAGAPKPKEDELLDFVNGR